MEYVYLKINNKSSLYKGLKKRNLIGWQDCLELQVNSVPNIGESFYLPYSSACNEEKNKTLNEYLNNRNSQALLKTEDIIITYLESGNKITYIKCEYLPNIYDWLSKRNN